jgi:hypothetical protein
MAELKSSIKEQPMDQSQRDEKPEPSVAQEIVEERDPAPAPPVAVIQPSSSPIADRPIQK